MKIVKSFFSKENLFISGGIIVGLFIYNKFISKYVG